jgi:cytochrome c-type protein NapC
MNDSVEQEKHPNWWKKLWQQPRSRYLIGIPLGGMLMFIAGIIFWGGFNTFMEATNTMGFCTGCHEMEYVYEEYQETVHFKNASGVKAICSDCHVPKPWTAKLVRKIQATNELFHKVLGTINTREKFEAKRLELAENVWASMKASDSRECRNCHALETMAAEEQDKSARKKHTLERKLAKDETCIDCHKGIAHALPEGYD